MIRRIALFAIALSACTDPEVTALPYPFSLALSADGALTGTATTDTAPTPFDILVDTGTPLTTYDDRSGKTRARIGKFTLLADGTTPRLEYNQVRLFIAPLSPVGFGAQPFSIAGVLGGDNLSRRTLTLDYRGPAPLVSAPSLLITGSCDLTAACNAVFPFTLAGGQETVQLGTDLYSYPATRVLVDVCLEPLADPVSQDVVCATKDPSNPPPTHYRYEPAGVEVKMMVATGLSGLIIGARAFDRLRGPGSADIVMAQSPGELHFADSPDPTPVGVTTLGDDMISSALALVSHEGTLGPCGELARSRRFRRSPPDMPREGETGCRDKQACDGRSSPPDNCSDFNDPIPAAAAIIELTKQIPAWVMSDTADFLVGVNADVRPSQATVEGIIGTEVLARIVSTIDYPSRRFVARCVSDDDCLTYARFSAEDAPCVPPSGIPQNPSGQFRAGGGCPPAP